MAASAGRLGRSGRQADRLFFRSVFSGTAGISRLYDRRFAQLGIRYVGSYKYQDGSVPSLRLEEKFDDHVAFDATCSYTFGTGDMGDLQLTIGAIDLFQADLPNLKDSLLSELFSRILLWRKQLRMSDTLFMLKVTSVGGGRVSPFQHIARYVRNNERAEIKRRCAAGMPADGVAQWRG